MPYESSSLLLPAAAGFARATLHGSAVPAGDKAASCAAAALLAQPVCLRALCALAGRSPGCATAQEACATALRAAVRGATTAQHLDALVDAGAPEALQLLQRNFRDAGAPAAAAAVAVLAQQLQAHPQHPERRTADV